MMSEHAEVVKALLCIENNTSCVGCKYYDGLTCNQRQLEHDAADAIVELSKEIEKYSDMIKRAYLIINSLLPHEEESECS